MHLRFAKRSDLQSIATVASRAFANQPIYHYFAPRHVEHKDEFRAVLLREIKERFATPGQVVMVAEEDDGNGKMKIAGYAIWIRIGGPRKWHKDTLTNNDGTELERSLLRAEAFYVEKRGSDEIFISPNAQRFHEMAEEIMKGANICDNHWHLNTIAVSPLFQNQGIGAMLIDWGLESAKEEGVPVTLESTTITSKLYVKKGFRDIGVIRVTKDLQMQVMIFNM
ncbi:MAG: hypothetical protein M1834_003214 [Cirrosporium novae-zelandiae]|nr:MAG: hypothetical protein M1834_003214 [Cirrosporium novae-zelandiae]